MCWSGSVVQSVYVRDTCLCPVDKKLGVLVFWTLSVGTVMKCGSPGQPNTFIFACVFQKRLKVLCLFYLVWMTGEVIGLTRGVNE